ncbi:MAG: DUF4252 domain-containing protein [Tannerellaceae bacterium]|jgi:hypothetical protein|nr:DUF4252 domain-containing protein [Tannerellaceae bacterium]
MKTKHILIILCFFCTTTTFAQDKLFDKYAEMDNVTSVYISKAMFQMMPTIANVGLNLMNMKGKIESLQLITTERADQIPQMRKEFTQFINKQHQELMRVKDGKTRATFYADMEGEQVKNLLMLADTDSSFTAIRLVGNFTLQDIQEITKDINK